MTHGSSSVILSVSGAGSITIIKDATPDDSQDFEFSRRFGANFSLDDEADPMPPHSQTFTDLAPGSYTVTEGAVPGWALTNLVCTDPDNVTTVDLNTRTATIDLDAGETVKRTFTNTRVEVNLLVLQGSGNCLEVDRDRGTYRFRAADGRVFTGAVILSQRGDLLSLQSPLLRGVTDLRRRLGAATLVLPFGPGRRVFSFVDRNIDDNTLCP